MSEAKNDANQAQPKKALTAADAAKAVKRPVTSVVMKDGKPVQDKDGNFVTKTEKVDVAAKEVLAFKEYDDGKIVVVTKDGQKFSSRDE